MDEETTDATDEYTDELAAMLAAHGAEATRGRTAAAAAREWAAAGFDDPSEVEEWLAARCFEPTAARSLDDAGITPEQAAAPTREGATDAPETIAHKVARGELSVEAARRIVTSSFWND